MTLENNIDALHYAILQTLDEPLWKSKIHAELGAQDDLPIDSTPSAQTVGRRTNELTRNDYLATSILSPDAVERDLVIGYKRLKKGDTAIEEKRDEMLQEISYTASNVSIEPQRTVSKPALVRMITEQFDLDTDATNRLDSNYKEKELISLLALHYAQKNADDLVVSKQSHAHSRDDAKNFQKLLQE